MRNLAFARRNKISAADFTRKQNALFPDRVKSALADAFDMWCLWDFFFRIWILSIWPIAASVILNYADIVAAAALRAVIIFFRIIFWISI